MLAACSSKIGTKAWRVTRALYIKGYPVQVGLRGRNADSEPWAVLCDGLGKPKASLEQVGLICFCDLSRS